MTERIRTSESFVMARSPFLGVDKSESWTDAPLDDHVDMYDRTMTSLLDKLAPSRTKTYRVRPSDVWIDDAAKKLSRIRKRQYKSGNLAADVITWINQLRSYRRLCDSKRSLFWKLQVEGSSMNPKKM